MPGAQVNQASACPVWFALAEVQLKQDVPASLLQTFLLGLVPAVPQLWVVDLGQRVAAIHNLIFLAG